MSLSFPLNIKGIIFDLDGTLYKMKWFMKPLLTIMLFPRCLMLPRYIALRKAFAGKEMHNGDNLLHAMAEKLSQKSGHNNPDAMLTWINNRFYPAFESIMPFLQGSRSGLIDTLKSLKEKRYKLAVLSDFARVAERIAGLNIPISLFDTIISSESEGSLKPCPRQLLAIAESWEMQPADILVIGDRDDTDGVAASRAGMLFIRISDKRKKPADTYNWQTIKEYLGNVPSIL